MVADGAAPPIDKACGEGLMPDSLRVLHELGVTLDRTDGFPFRGIRFVGEGGQVDASFPLGGGLGLRRMVLHEKMIEEAERLGIQLHWRTSVTGINPEGVIARGRTIAARWIVGADGIRSRVRRWCAIQAAASARPRFAFRRHFQLTPWTDCVEIYWAPNAQAYVTPVGGSSVCVVVISRNPGMRSGSIAAEFPALADRLIGTEAGLEAGAVTLTCEFEQVYRGNIALIGDASGSVDAITGEGLSLSFHQATALADAFERDDLRLYQAAHRRLARRPRMMAHLLLLLDSSPRLRTRVLRSMEMHPEVFARLLAIHVGETSPAHLAATGALLGWRLAAA
jgi:2-polyprenyl-6-methoxyphenol hydroxylase-like FAD-dependent oxidoreductase